MIQVSVIIPVKNRVPELQRAIQSVLQQDFTSYEILVIDDGPSLKIEELVHNLKHESIRYFANTGVKHNANVCRNIGLKEARGKYVAMLDSDDAWLPSHLSLRIQELEKLSVDGLFGSVLIDNGEQQKVVLSRAIMPEESMTHYLLTDGSAPTPSHFYTRESAVSILWDEDLLRHQDYDFSIRYAARYRFLPSQNVTTIVYWIKTDKKRYHLPSQIAFYKKHADSIPSAIAVKKLVALYSEIRKDNQISVDEVLSVRVAALSFGYDISLTDYCELYPASGFFGKILRRIRYFLYRRSNRSKAK